jgi:hypothetical protein
MAARGSRRVRWSGGLSRALSTWLSLWDDPRVDCDREGLFVDAVSPSYKGYRYPAEVIAHCVWLYHRFPLSFARSRSSCSPAARSSPARRSGSGARSSGPPMPVRSGVAGPGPGASGTWRGLREDQRRGALPVAGSRPGRQRPGHPGPEQAGREGRQAVPARADEEAVPHAAGPGHRQAPQLRRRPPAR